MLRLLGRSTSINVRKVQWTCAELGLAYAHEQSAGADLTTPAFLALNPNGLIPVLLDPDHDLVLWQSNAICRYLALREGRDDLLPPNAAQRARVDQWMDWQSTELNGAWIYAFQALVRKLPERDDPVAVARSVDAWNRHMRLLDDQLARTGAYVAGATFTLADIVVGLAACRWTLAPIGRPALPAVAAWMARLDEREPYRRFGANGMP